MTQLKKPVFYVLTFDSTSFAIQAEKQIKEAFKSVVMPTPRELTASCGLAVKFLEDCYEDIVAYVTNLEIPCKLYSMTVEKVDGKRETELLFYKEV